MTKPLIGVNPYYFERHKSWWNATQEKYYKAVYLAGGIPMTLHHVSSEIAIEEIANKIDGFVMVGGPDLPHQTYNSQNPDLLDEDVMHKDREQFDRTLFLAMKNKGKPILAICVGFQHINVIYGGTLYEDIPSQTKESVFHGVFNGDWVEHSVRLKDKCLIAQAMGTTNSVIPSTHHQGIRKLGDGLRAVAWAEDGLIEAIEDKKTPDAFIAVQWHPEIDIQSQEQLRLFQWLTKKAATK
ncbi:MAG: C26 family cysteine hydrolase domain-containing family [Candidatus Marinimicrobia bacterium]|jgi:putative glutamine amidotransferase|nr:C26 family cysteine hydrolase domain-containing family [Candidatus Neomarinimicrobiota bacterium]MBT3495575.1 C26 family cysteine hydrolase domain-containing family [Candidatus Neomarinimicrobiota bacterium]MBT3731796.1 C26 family cysteine hydrolase domain-containing family [Candidatus Neomarinimicrobiota bacterium]MBT4177440.1 C26 family cysteine hydrolase domain-containing family [Candidatus Neomarinimicrobiota bacterium]MBT4593315.1 C26 family cysteine hydrolase domain-containing family [